MPSDVQVYVRFQEKCVFAGEEFNCIVTFKNAAPNPEPPSANPSNRGASSLPRQVSQNHGHLPRRSISTSLPRTALHKTSYSISSPPLSIDTSLPTTSTRSDPRHQRSVSIVSLNSPPISAPIGPGSNDDKRTPKLGHRRSSTVQLATDSSRRVGLGVRQLSADFRSPGRRSPLSATHTPPEMKLTTPEFKFPAVKPSDASIQQQNTANLTVLNRPNHRGVASISQSSGHRDSLDAYNHSNHSGETLASEQTSMISERPQLASIAQLPQRASSVVARKSKAVTLLMGYAQVNATFTLDASLVDQTPFEEVKKKGFLGGQAGGGVVGVKKKTRPGSSFFSGFNFSSLGESLDNIIGSENLSSVKEMRAVSNSRSIPLLSTPQSLLFVDLRLEPGEEKVYSFAYRLPKGLPSSYRGKAIKILYNLVIGVQGAPGAKEMQAVRQVNVPIRVFSGVDSEGEIFGHDLMQPYVILKDLAKTKLVNPSEEELAVSKQSQSSRDMSSKDFLQYVDTLLVRHRRRQSSVGTIDTLFGAVDTSGSETVRAINRAVLLSNQPAASNDSSPNKFEIARSGSRIATVILDRPLHRIGETITTVIDLSRGQMTCASLRATLESSERVEDELAVRAASAISRISRKIHASQSENVLFSKRAVFCPTIPTNATPTFVTSGVSLDWYIKLEFGTVRAENNGEDPNQKIALLEEIMKDERGTVNVAVESIDCDTFEVSIPITVYGDIVSDGKDDIDGNGFPI